MSEPIDWCGQIDTLIARVEPETGAAPTGLTMSAIMLAWLEEQIRARLQWIAGDFGPPTYAGLPITINPDVPDWVIYVETNGAAER
jgi:hypothetical protein